MYQALTRTWTKLIIAPKIERPRTHGAKPYVVNELEKLLSSR
jgi:hypothetical protein